METIVDPYSPDRHHMRSTIRSSCCNPVIVRLGKPGFGPIPRWRLSLFLEHHIVTWHERLATLRRSAGSTLYLANHPTQPESRLSTLEVKPVARNVKCFSSC